MSAFELLLLAIATVIFGHACWNYGWIRGFNEARAAIEARDAGALDGEA